jgi:hypothetical protein
MLLKFHVLRCVVVCDATQTRRAVTRHRSLGARFCWDGTEHAVVYFQGVRKDDVQR